MAPPAGRISPARYLWLFAAIVVVLYALVFGTGDHKPLPKLGLDLRGGTQVTLTARTDNGQPPDRDALNEAKRIIDERVNGLGVTGSEVLLDGNNITITVPGDDGRQARSLGQTARLDFREVVQSAPAPAQPGSGPQSNAFSPTAISRAKAERQSTDPAQQQQALTALKCGPAVADPLQGNDDPKLPLVTCGKDGYKYILNSVFIPGTEINSATASPNPQGVGYVINLTFKSTGSKTWADFTSKNIGKQTAVTLDTQVVSAPQVQSAILDGNTQISGSFSQAQAQDLASVLKYGSLPLSFSPSDAHTISASLGLASLKGGLIAGAIGLILVFLYCLFYYRLLGVLTIASLALSGILVYAVLVLLGRWIGFSLDLAGVAGLIISIGITADSFVIFFERIKDEVRAGRSFRSAVPRAWVRARRTILSGDAVSFLAAVILYTLALGDVRGFAFTLGMSTLLDIVVVFLVTHPLVVYASRSQALSNPSLSGLGTVHRSVRPAIAGRGV